MATPIPDWRKPYKRVKLNKFGVTSKEPFCGIHWNDDGTSKEKISKVQFERVKAIVGNVHWIEEEQVLELVYDEEEETIDDVVDRMSITVSDLMEGIKEKTEYTSYSKIANFLSEELDEDYSAYEVRCYDKGTKECPGEVLEKLKEQADAD